MTLRGLISDSARLAEYLKVIPTKQYARLMNTAMEADLLHAVVNALSRHFLPANDFSGVCAVLTSLTTVKRFDLAAVGLDRALTRARRAR